MEAPLKPDPSDCCSSGCNPCILDVYEEQLKRYERQKDCPSSAPSRNCISQTVYTNFAVTAIEKHTENSYVYIFKCASESSDHNIIKYEPGQHFLMRGFDGKAFTRAYTPIPYKNTDTASFAVLIRLYERGRMSRILRGLKIGDEASWRGPYGDFQIKYDCRHLLLIAQGTGIAPIYSVIVEMLDNDDCEVFLKLFFSCRNAADILLRDELYKLKSHWNFTYEVFLSDGENLAMKYGEVVHKNRLNHCDVTCFFEKKNRGDCRALICGSESFSGDFFKCVCECIDSKYIHVF